MADFSFSDDPELQKLHAQVLEEPEEFEHWEKLVRAAESQEGGLHRNSSPSAIAATRAVYDEFLTRFPLFFGYWKKYADLEFSIAGTEAAEMVFERGVASIATSVDLWHSYCGFKVETSHDADVIRELFERGAECVGLDFLAHIFWDKYLEFEERSEAQDRIFAILNRVIHIPMHQYSRFFERYRLMAPKRPVMELAPQEVVVQFQQELVRESGGQPQDEREFENALRKKLDDFHVEIFQRTQAETSKRWTYEQDNKRPYYHVTELDELQLGNWRKYLDFEEAEGDYTRTKFLYERCLVTTANYEEFWLRYARWMLAQESKQEEVRNIYQRASCVYVPIARPMIRLFYAQFEESQDRPDVAVAIHEAILMNLPNDVETIVSLANVYRRQYGVDAAIEALKKYIDDAAGSIYTRGALVSEWARLVWKVNGNADEARDIYVNNQPFYLDSQAFWTSWLEFEMQQPPSVDGAAPSFKRVQSVYGDIRQKSRLPPALIKELSLAYFAFLKERGGKDAMKELMQLDREINGPFSVASGTKEKLAEDVIMKDSATQKRSAMENGHLSAEPNLAQAPVNGRHPIR